MSHYRFGPRKIGALFAGTLVATAAYLALPAVLINALPAPAPVVETVALGYEGADWEEEMPGLRCARDFYGLSSYTYDCDGTIIQTWSTGWTDDPEHTLRRMVRANSVELSGTEGIVLPSGDNYMYFFASQDPQWAPHTIAMTVRGEGDDDDKVLFAMVTGSDYQDVAYLGDRAWETLTGTPMSQELLDHPRFRLPDSVEPTVPMPRTRDL